MEENKLQSIITDLGEALAQKRSQCSQKAEEHLVNMHRNAGAVAMCDEFIAFLKTVMADEVKPEAKEAESHG